MFIIRWKGKKITIHKKIILFIFNIYLIRPFSHLFYNFKDLELISSISTDSYSMTSFDPTINRCTPRKWLILPYYIKATSFIVMMLF